MIYVRVKNRCILILCQLSPAVWPTSYSSSSEMDTKKGSVGAITYIGGIIIYINGYSTLHLNSSSAGRALLSPRTRKVTDQLKNLLTIQYLIIHHLVYLFLQHVV